MEGGSRAGGDKNFVAMSVDLLRNNEYLIRQDENKREKTCRINGDLSTIELIVCTISDSAQEDLLHHVNSLIDAVKSVMNLAVSRFRCQQFRHTCITRTTDTGTSCRRH